jgi:hypothetical protein
MPRDAVDRLAPRVPGTDVLRNPDGDFHRPFGHRASNNAASVCRTPSITRGRSPSGAFLMLRQLTRLSGLSSHHTGLEQTRRPSWPEVGARASVCGCTDVRAHGSVRSSDLPRPSYTAATAMDSSSAQASRASRARLWSEQTDLQSVLILQPARGSSNSSAGSCGQKRVRTPPIPRSSLSPNLSRMARSQLPLRRPRPVAAA